MQSLLACRMLSRGLATIDKDPGFAVYDLHDLDGQLTVTAEGTTYKGYLDVGVAPQGLMGYSIVQQLRVGFELKHTQDQKRRYRLQGEACSRMACGATIVQCQI